MSTMTIVEDLDVLEDGRPGLLSGRPGLAMEQLGLESGEEALSDGIVPARPGRPTLCWRRCSASRPA